MGKDLKGKELGRGISQRKDKYYVGRYTTRNGKRVQKLFAKLQECKKWLADEQYTDEHSNPDFPSDMLVDAWFDYWISVKKRTVRPNTLRNYTERYKRNIKPVIGNKILPDGTHKTGIGDFIRRTSLDEFPQFFNVLRGDMSIIGTRPPLISETNLYELHHRARLAIKPGITGMWQVSGRSDITDFEEVVRLDKEYITNWNIGLDIKILFKTVLVVFKKDGSM